MYAVLPHQDSLALGAAGHKIQECFKVQFEKLTPFYTSVLFSMYFYFQFKSALVFFLNKENVYPVLKHHARYTTEVKIDIVFTSTEP